MPQVEDAIEEVVNGEIQITPPPRFPHATVVDELRNILCRQLDRNSFPVFVSRFGLIIRRDPLTCRGPDLAVFDKSKIVVIDDYVHSAPQLAAEVLAPGQTRNELEAKLRDYESLGVAEVWVVSREAGTFEVLHLKDGKLVTVALLREGILRPIQFPEVAVDIASVWPD